MDRESFDVDHYTNTYYFVNLPLYFISLFSRFVKFSQYGYTSAIQWFCRQVNPWSRPLCVALPPVLFWREILKQLISLSIAGYFYLQKIDVRIKGCSTACLVLDPTLLVLFAFVNVTHYCGFFAVLIILINFQLLCLKLVLLDIENISKINTGCNLWNCLQQKQMVYRISSGLTHMVLLLVGDLNLCLFEFVNYVS